MTERTKGIFLRVSALIIFGLMGVLAKVIPANPFLLVFSTQTAGLIVFFTWSLKKDRLQISRGELKRIAVATFFILVSDIAFFAAAKTLPLANAVFIKFTFPIFVALLAPLLLNEHFRKNTAYAIILGFTGLFTILSKDLSGFELRGSLFALTSAISLAFFFVAIKKVFEKSPVHRWLFYRYLMASLALFPLVFSTYDRSFSIPQWIPALTGFGLLFGVIASLLDMEGLKRIPAQEASVLGYAEPLSAVLYGFVLLSQPITLGVGIGGLLIIASGVLIVRTR